MPPSVQAARAAKYPVRLDELQVAVGEYLAKKLKCEAAIVTAGRAASALTLATAATMTLGNQGVDAQHPDRSKDMTNVMSKFLAMGMPLDEMVAKSTWNVTGLKNEVIAKKGHRYEYDHAIRKCGAKFVEVVYVADYEAAFNERTVMTNFFNGRQTVWVPSSLLSELP